MRCPSCGSDGQMEFPAEVYVHLPGLRNVNELPVLVFPGLLVCLDCGASSFATPAEPLEELRAHVGRQ
jgi:hypothetical protein